MSTDASLIAKVAQDPGLIAERFWSKVEKTDTCWLWKRYLTHGYGRFFVKADPGQRNKLLMAHRVSYAMHFGPIANGLEVDHRCCNRACVNPEHLRLATPKQNSENHISGYKNGRSGVRGVCWNKQHQKWVAHVRSAGKRYHLGYYTDIEEAKQAAIEARNRLFTHNDADRIAA